MIFIGLTIFVSVSEIDFSFMGMFLFIGLLAFMVWGLINIIFGFHMNWLFALVGCLLFSGFIIYDSFMIMNHMGCDDYMIGESFAADSFFTCLCVWCVETDTTWFAAVIDLYLDILNLFSMILAFMNLDM